MKREDIKTPQDLKEFLKAEAERKNPSVAKDFDIIWLAMEPMLKTEKQIRSFLATYTA